MVSQLLPVLNYDSFPKRHFAENVEYTVRKRLLIVTLTIFKDYLVITVTIFKKYLIVTIDFFQKVV